jgi:Tripartite tricarboxylate transporter TctB family
MKQFKWPRPPFILGAVLGDTIERYMFISVERYGISWFARPVVAILFIMAGIGLLRPLVQDIKSQGGVINMTKSFQGPRFQPSQLFTIFMLGILSSMVIMATSWDFSAKIVPMVVGGVGITVCVLSLFNDMCRKPTVHATESLAASAQHEVEQKIHMDLASDTEHLPVSLIIKRAARFFGYLVAFMGVMAVIGLVPTVALFVVIFMRYENKEPWKLVITYAIVLVFAISFVFDNVMSIPWPPTLIAQWFPALKFLPSI